MRIIISGLIAQYPFGGVAWDYIGYLIGFRELGHEVYYLEDTGTWPYDPINQTISADCTYNVDYLERVMRFFGFEEHWIYRNGADGCFYGAGEEKAHWLMEETDLLVHVASITDLSHYKMDKCLRIFIDGDPMFTQVGLLSQPDSPYTQSILKHDLHFTYGLKVGNPDCIVPQAGIQWRKTLPCLPLEYWPWPLERERSEPACYELTSVLNWVSYKPCTWQDKVYGQKDIEFLKMIDLPARTSKKFTMAMGQGIGSKRPTELLEEKGWKIVEPETVADDWLSYRNFIRSSQAEWSIAKHGYVEARTGWFSGRSVCYLASGLPVILQNTGWDEYLPSGKGLLTFSNLEESVGAVNQVFSHYEQHSLAARNLAETYFDAKKVCADLMDEIEQIDR